MSGFVPDWWWERWLEFVEKPTIFEKLFCEAADAAPGNEHDYDQQGLFYLTNCRLCGKPLTEEEMKP